MAETIVAPYWLITVRMADGTERTIEWRGNWLAVPDAGQLRALYGPCEIARIERVDDVVDISVR